MITFIIIIIKMNYLSEIEYNDILREKVRYRIYFVKHEIFEKEFITHKSTFKVRTIQINNEEGYFILIIIY